MIALLVFHLIVVVIRPDGQAVSLDLGRAGSQAECWATAGKFIREPVPPGWRLALVGCAPEGKKA